MAANLDDNVAVGYLSCWPSEPSPPGFPGSYPAGATASAGWRRAGNRPAVFFGLLVVLSAVAYIPMAFALSSAR
jgi:hypothetical protein